MNRALALVGVKFSSSTVGTSTLPLIAQMSWHTSTSAKVLPMVSCCLIPSPLKPWNDMVSESLLPWPLNPLLPQPAASRTHVRLRAQIDTRDHHMASSSAKDSDHGAARVSQAVCSVRDRC